ncbi:MAG: glycosyltransferase family 2 protein [Rickettsiales bacterium]|nr:glycosyltransferase family 2 protein [Rickettsiales bacterium]
MSIPKVSVIIPTYNRANILSRALESVLNQTFTDYELIIVDDGSTDHTRNTLSHYEAEARITIIYHPKNRGAAAARNTGINSAKGTYIAFLDSDDEWLPTKLAKQVAALEVAPNTPLSFTGVSLQRAKSTTRTPKKTHATWLQSMLCGQSFCPGSTLLIRRSVFQEIGMQDESLRRLEDIDWLIRYFSVYDSIALIPEPLARIYVSGAAQQKVILAAIDHIYRKHIVAIRNAAALDYWKEYESAACYWRAKQYSAFIRQMLKRPQLVKQAFRRVIRA